MYDKSWYRTSLNNIKSHVKLGVFADDIGLSRSTLSLFLKDEKFDYQISVEKLDTLYKEIKNYTSNI